MDTLIEFLTDNLEKLIEKKKECDDLLKTLEPPRPVFFIFFSTFFKKLDFDSPSFIKVLMKLWLYQSKFYQNFD